MRKLKSQSLGPKKPKRQITQGTDGTDFLEYQEYLELFSVPHAKIRDELKPKPGKNAEIFTKFVLEKKKAAIQAMQQRAERSVTNKPSKVDRLSSNNTYLEEKSENLRASKQGESSRTQKTDSSILKGMDYKVPLLPLNPEKNSSDQTPKQDSSFLSGLKDTTTRLIYYENKPKPPPIPNIKKEERRIPLTETKDIKRLVESNKKYARTLSITKPRASEYTLIGNKRMQDLQVGYFRKLGVLETFKNHNTTVL